jgi:hypothetical protein
MCHLHLWGQAISPGTHSDCHSNTTDQRQHKKPEACDICGLLASSDCQQHNKQQRADGHVLTQCKKGRAAREVVTSRVASQMSACLLHAWAAAQRPVPCGLPAAWLVTCTAHIHGTTALHSAQHKYDSLSARGPVNAAA